ncbi:hypothetical protein [Vitiosangium sp. GDMCC 1.1324]|uniref:hypothetical protein n=1 Tax=Vitiosangium sp. (strain GDMCC 1.1324) TaxID=2138576 RepID=UPI000D339100|nr:hypothetical protein [Vitiosangium sp. GDMCC 1.1324]PTL79704.1 hypothetical protein DAT35_33435 [Vitiosangium sp. GDMCC 1.1324]
MRRALSAVLSVVMLALSPACHGGAVVRQDPLPELKSGTDWHDSPRFRVQRVSGPQSLEPTHGARPDYDSFSDSTGQIRDEHVAAAQAMVQDSEVLEQVYEDAVRGDARAARVFQELETRFFPDIGRAVAEQTGSLSCAVPVYRELSGMCVPNWAFIDFLRKDRQGGIRLRRALGDAYEARARELGVKNAVIVNALKALMAGVIMKGALAGTAVEARVATQERRAPLAEVGGGEPPRLDGAPKLPLGPKPPLESPEAARWRYDRYLYDQHAAGRPSDEVLDFERWKSTYFDPVVKGGRPGRSGGPAQVSTRQQLAMEEGYINSESTRLGNKVVDMYRPNVQGGIDYVEVDSILQNGLPRAAMREKLKIEIRALERNDTLLFVDKLDRSKRILYRFGEDVSVVDTRRVGGK